MGYALEPMSTALIWWLYKPARFRDNAEQKSTAYRAARPSANASIPISPSVVGRLRGQQEGESLLGGCPNWNLVMGPSNANPPGHLAGAGGERSARLCHRRANHNP